MSTLYFSSIWCYFNGPKICFSFKNKLLNSSVYSVCLALTILIEESHVWALIGPTLALRTGCRLLWCLDTIGVYSHVSKPPRRPFPRSSPCVLESSTCFERYVWEILLSHTWFETQRLIVLVIDLTLHNRPILFLHANQAAVLDQFSLAELSGAGGSNPCEPTTLRWDVDALCCLSAQASQAQLY